MKLRKTLVWILCVLLLLSLSGCGSAMAPNLDQVTEDMDYAAKDEITTDTEGSSSLPENRKLIQTVRMSVETDDLNAVLTQLDSRIAELGGYIESSNVQNSGSQRPSASITVRIPADRLNDFVDRVGDVSNVVSSRKTVEDVTLSYVATESRMKALQAEEARLLELMAVAETLEDLLTVEKRLTEVRTELEQVTSALRLYDNQVDYATVHLSIQQVKEYTENTEPETVWQRISTGFVESLKGVGNFLEELFVFLVVAIPYLVLIAVVPLAVFLIVRGNIRRKRKNCAKQNENNQS